MRITRRPTPVEAPPFNSIADTPRCTAPVHPNVEAAGQPKQSFARGFVARSPASQSASLLQLRSSKRFPLEGLRGDLFAGLPPISEARHIDSPTLRTKLLPALDAMEQTVALLGSSPSPEDVDASNIRRIIRAIEPILNIFAKNYGRKKLGRAAGQLRQVVSRLGKYKDVAVIEAQTRQVFPNGQLPKKLARSLSAHKEKQRANFESAYAAFSRKGLPKALATLRAPDRTTNDAKRLTKALQAQLDQVQRFGIIHTDVGDFHTARKAMRTLLNTLQVARGVVDVDPRAMAELHTLVDAYGQVQDTCVAARWLRKNGFKKPAREMEARATQQQKLVLEKGRTALTSGLFNKLSSSP